MRSAVAWVALVSFALAAPLAGCGKYGPPVRVTEKKAAAAPATAPGAPSSDDEEEEAQP